jgi:hypothetical protein
MAAHRVIRAPTLGIGCGSLRWLHSVERCFAELNNWKIRRSAHDSVTNLETGIRKWIIE